MATKSVLSNVDLIRKFVFEHQPVSMDEIVPALRAEMQAIRSDEMARDKYIIPVLNSQPYYLEKNGRWEIIRDEMPEYKVLEDAIRAEHRLLYDREVRSKVAARLGVKVVTVVLDLAQAPGLKPFGTRWGLKDWEIVNDIAAEVLDQHPGGLSEKDLYKHVCERGGINPDNAILDLKRDKQKRFVQERKLWLLKIHQDEKKKAAKETKQALPDLKGKGVDLLLEGSFLQAQTTKADEETDDRGRPAKTRLKKALKKQAQEMLEQREDLSTKPEDLAARLSQVLTAAGVEEYEVTSFQRVEPAPKERGLSQKEREEITEFVDQMLAQETTGVGPSLQSVVNSPLSARKMQDVLRLKYIGYTRDRAVIPNEYYRLLVDLLEPTINSAVINPSCFEGNLAVELFAHVYERLDGAAWALADEDSKLEIVQPDGARYKLDAKDEALADLAKDKFIVSQVDLLNHFINFRYTGIEPDPVMAKSARIITRLSGHENVYIVNRDYLSELPQIFSQPDYGDNQISQQFDIVTGNYTFTQDANLGANFFDQSLKLLKPGGSCGIFVLEDLLKLIKEHRLLGEFMEGRAVTHFIRLPVIEGRHKIVLLIVQDQSEAEEIPNIINAEVRDFKAANHLGMVLSRHSDTDEEEGARSYRLVEQQALASLIE